MVQKVFKTGNSVVVSNPDLERWALDVPQSRRTIEEIAMWLQESSREIE